MGNSLKVSGFNVLQTLTVICFFVFGLVDSANADTEYDEAVSRCNTQFPSLFEDYLARSSCVSDAEAALSLREELRAREALDRAARPCVASQLPDMEKKLKNLLVNLELRQPKSVSEATSAIKAELGVDSLVVIPEDMIFEKVVVAYIQPNCETNFSYNVNVRFDANGKARWLAVFAIDPPKGLGGVGYGGYVERFSFNFEEAAKQAQMEAEEQRRQAEVEQKLRQQDLLLSQVHFKAVEVDCLMNGCQSYRYRFRLTNNSSSLISSASFSIAWVVGQVDDPCPRFLPLNYVIPQINLYPSETRDFEVYGGADAYSGLPLGPVDHSQLIICGNIVSVVAN